MFLSGFANDLDVLPEVGTAEIRKDYNRFAHLTGSTGWGETGPKGRRAQIQEPKKRLDPKDGGHRGDLATGVPVVEKPCASFMGI